MTSMKDTQKKKSIVLIVDDERKVLRFMEIDLRFRGFEVITATSGEEAMKLIKSAKPDIMLLDIVMPRMDGFQVLRQLRAFSQLPVVAFSASITNYDEAMRLGANAFISKPFKTDDMVSKINACLSH
jgi:two-component system KDP operon response regulator KdpE